MPSEDDYLVYNYNRFQACRFGLEGSIVASQNIWNSIAARGYSLHFCRKITPYAESLGSLDAIEPNRSYTRRQRRHYLQSKYDERGSAEGIVDSALNMFREINYNTTQK